MNKFISAFIFSLISYSVFAQQQQTSDSIINILAGFEIIDEEQFPDAVVYSKDDGGQVYVEHNGIKMWCNRAFFYRKTNFIRAIGDVRMNQGDTIKMTSRYAEYNGNSQLAFASGEVLMNSPETTLETDTLFFDRIKQESYYRSGGTVKDSTSTLTSKKGHYFMTQKKYEFTQDVVVVNPEYTINSPKLNFYSDSSHAYLYGPSTILGENSTVYCERGFYDTRADEGYFVKNSRIDYDSRTVVGDSLYFNRKTSFASATNNIIITDTLNNSIVKGHYAQVYRDRDSVLITKRALAISTQETDSIYIHADTLMVTGSEDARVMRGYPRARIFKSDLSGKCDSIIAIQRIGLTKLIDKPVLWSQKNQITGDSIHLINNLETDQLDSLHVFYNAFMISKDTVVDSYNQIKGKELIGNFKDNELYLVKIKKNVENLNFLVDEAGKLIGIDKGTCGTMYINFIDQDVASVEQVDQMASKIYPPEELPTNARKLRGFNWRIEEKPLSVNDLFKGKEPPQLTPITGLPLPVVENSFFNKTNTQVNKNSKLKEGSLIPKEK